MNAIPVPFDQPALRRPSPFTLAAALAVTLPLLISLRPRRRTQS